jgi:hypothetical protein
MWQKLCVWLCASWRFSFMRLLKVFSTNIFVLLACTMAVHVGLGILGGTTERDAVGDVVNVYQPWAEALHPAGKWLGLAAPWVYPFLGWAPILVAKSLSFTDYLNAWMLFAGALNLVVVGELTAWGKRLAGFKGAWFYLAFLALLGPVSITRLDGISVAVALLGIASITMVGERLATSGALAWFMAAAWIKVWPVALILAALQKGKELKRQLLVLGVSLAVILGVAVLLGANENLFSFVTMQNTRGLQIESPSAMVFIWLGFFGLAHGAIYFDGVLVTYQVYADGAPQIAALMGAAMVLAIGITAWLMWRGSKAGANPARLMALTALTATLDLIVFNKVGSPQYQLWLVAAVVLGLILGVKNWRVPTVITLVLAGLTQMIYPMFYDDIVAMHWPALVLLTLRNAGLIYLLVWANLRLGELSKPALTEATPN